MGTSTQQTFRCRFSTLLFCSATDRAKKAPKATVSASLSPAYTTAPLVGVRKSNQQWKEPEAGRVEGYNGRRGGADTVSQRGGRHVHTAVKETLHKQLASVRLAKKDNHYRRCATPPPGPCRARFSLSSPPPSHPLKPALTFSSVCPSPTVDEEKGNVGRRTKENKHSPPTQCIFPILRQILRPLPLPLGGHTFCFGVKDCDRERKQKRERESGEKGGRGARVGVGGWMGGGGGAMHKCLSAFVESTFRAVS